METIQTGNKTFTDCDFSGAVVVWVIEKLLQVRALEARRKVLRIEGKNSRINRQSASIRYTCDLIHYPGRVLRFWFDNQGLHFSPSTPPPLSFSI